MKNRNLVLFVVLSMGLLLGYSYIVGKMYPPKPMAVAEAVPSAPAPQKAPELTKSVTPAPASLAPTPSPVPASVPAATHTLKLASLRLTWRVEDGAIVQAEWTPDGTKFFTEEEKNPTGVEVSRPFPGIGGVLGQTRFDQVFEEVTPSGVKVHFKNGIGDQLTYSVPKEGHAIEATWSTQRGAHLALIPRPSDVKEAEHLGRVFTLDDKQIHAAAWTSILKDPFFSFLGSKRSEMPPAASLLGMDAGVEKGVSGQRTHYFAALWDVSPRMTERDNQGYHLAPDQNGNLTARLYLGPKETNELQKFGAPFTRVVDFGFFGAVAKLLFLVLHWIHRFVPNWGWALIIFTVLLRALLWPLNNKSTLNQLRMKDFEPHQKALQAKYDKFGGDMAKKAEMQKELMALYKKNDHNPMGGCLPALLQMPVFFALWSMLSAVYELRQAPWIGWIHDLSAKDPHYVLPVLLGASMLAQQAVAPPMGDPAQRKMMLFLMPAMMTFIFAQSSSGLCLYYFVFTVVGLIQTWWIKRNYVGQEIVA